MKFKIKLHVLPAPKEAYRYLNKIFRVKKVEEANEKYGYYRFNTYYPESKRWGMVQHLTGTFVGNTFTQQQIDEHVSSGGWEIITENQIERHV